MIGGGGKTAPYEKEPAGGGGDGGDEDVPALGDMAGKKAAGSLRKALAGDDDGAVYAAFKRLVDACGADSE